MVSFEEIKKIPKLDLHINFLSSITDNLAFSIDDELSFNDVIDMSTLKRISEYDKCLELPIKLLNNIKNIKLAVVDLINKLKRNNVIYSELFLDLPLYNQKFSLEYLVRVLLDTIKDEQYDLNLVLCFSDKFSKEENMEIFNVLEKFYQKGVCATYFKKEHDTNLADYIYLFDKLIKQDIPYIVPFDDAITNQNREIYQNAYRIEYLQDGTNQELLEFVKEKNIFLEISFSRIQELSFNTNIYDLIFNLIKDNYNIAICSYDMTVLNTDIINEYCLLFNNTTLNLLEFVKLLLNCINKLRIDDIMKERLIKVLKEESNKIL